MRAQMALGALGGHSAEHQELALWSAVAAFVLIVVILVLLYRKTAKAVEMEEVDAILREEDVW